MSYHIDTAKDESIFDKEDIFEDSSFLAKLDNTLFNENTHELKNNLNNSGLNISALCCDEEISGYDKLTGATWIYPTNYPVRDYQFNIIQASMLKNTLVSLPTGLGKTFIAAVIMYNFYRWYPLGKIVFTAPTRPLVAQQIDACYNIVAIPSNDTIEMTGHMQSSTRKAHWQNKRVFFATPQVVYNDIKSGICPAEKIRCLVIDEAHRARGNYAYCQIVSSMTDMGHKTYRILALSATPGSKVEDVVNVVKNLHIANLELRTENCIDVAPYSHARKINTVIVQLGPVLMQLRQQYVEILDDYARRLKQLNILPQNVGNMSKGRIVMLYKEYQTRDRSIRHPQHNYIMKDFTLLIALYHGLELLVKHGSRVFLNFFDEHPEKSWIQTDDRLTSLLERLRDDLGINPLSLDTSILPDGTVSEIPNNLCFGHPKFDKLKEIMVEHFTKAKDKGQDTKAIVFCEYRESVNLVHCLLLQCRPLIVPQMFVGQGASGKDGKAVVSQKQQLRVMRSFREGSCNALVATCVAEEGLDVGSVDLILCFDISTRSPIRLVQRCGRTGRERGGQVFILVTEGREHQTLMDCMRQRDGLNRKILQSKEVKNNLYKSNPRLVPHDFTPQCQKMYITVKNKNDAKTKNNGETSKKGQKDLRNMLLGKVSSHSSTCIKTLNNVITEDEFDNVFPEGLEIKTNIAEPAEHWYMSKEKFKSLDLNKKQSTIELSTWIEWQRTLQKTINIGHSKDTDILTDLLQYSDAKRFELPPSTQNPTFSTQQLPTENTSRSPVKQKQPKKKTKPPSLMKSPSKKDGDIRALFSTATKSTKSYTKLISDLGIPSDGSIPTNLINLFVDLKLNTANNNKICYICQNVCQCTIFLHLRKQNDPKPSFSLAFLNELKLPDVDLIDDISSDVITTYFNGIKNIKEFDDIKDAANDSSLSHNHSKNFDLEFDFESPVEINSPTNMLKPKIEETTEKNFDVGEIEDLFAESSPEEVIEKNNAENLQIRNDNPKETLDFFGLHSIDDIFAESDDGFDDDKVENQLDNEDNNHGEQNINEEKLLPKSKPLQLSPSILSGRLKTTTDIPTSPILCSQVKKFQLSTKKNRTKTPSTTANNVRRKLLPETLQCNESKSISIDEGNNNKTMLTITQLVEMINKTGRSEPSALESNNFKETSINEIERCTSPIILTQADLMLNSTKRSTSPVILTQADLKLNSTKQNESFKNNQNGSCSVSKNDSLIILGSSDSEGDETQIYELKNDINKNVNKSPSLMLNNSLNSNKRKLEFEDDDDHITSSPYFNKRRKLERNDTNVKTFKDKVLAALASDKIKNNNTSNNTNVNFMLTSSVQSQKENKTPFLIEDTINQEYKKANFRDNLNILQIFNKDSKVKNPKEKLTEILQNGLTQQNPNQDGESNSPKCKRSSYNSDDDFVIEDKYKNETRLNNNKLNGSTTRNHKIRKKKKKDNQFLDLEAELSEEHSDSGDEMSDDSVGSIIDFICDENISTHEDMQAIYLKSVKSPIKGKFKIPELPSRFNKMNVLSQFVEEDAYEMDSFCVDSHIGLTQANDVSELELAEMILEERKRKKKVKVRTLDSILEKDDSPVLKEKKRVKRLIHSDSDDSS